MDLKKEKETFFVARKDFTEAEASTSQAPANLKADEKVKPFLQACMKFLRNPKVVENLQALIDSYTVWPNLPPEIKDVHKLYRYKKRIVREMRLTTQIDGYETDQVILDLGSNANVLPKQMWQRMGEPNLEWSTIQLRIANQQKIIPLGRLLKIVVDIAEVKVRANFQVIQIVEDVDPYPALLGLD